MKSLDRRAAETLRALAAFRKTDIGCPDDPSLAVRFEIAGRTEGYTLLALTHFEPIDGRRLRAPEMHFAYVGRTGRFIPIHYRNDLLEIDSYSVIPAADSLRLRDAALQEVHHRHATRWLHRLGRHLSLADARRPAPRLRTPIRTPRPQPTDTRPTMCPFRRSNAPEQRINRPAGAIFPHAARYT